MTLLKSEDNKCKLKHSEEKIAGKKDTAFIYRLARALPEPSK